MKVKYYSTIWQGVNNSSAVYRTVSETLTDCLFITFLQYLSFLALSPGQTNEQSWILHPTLLEVNVDSGKTLIQHC